MCLTPSPIRMDEPTMRAAVYGGAFLGGGGGGGLRGGLKTMQDVLSLGADARMNTPATIGGNWSWRVRREAINGDVAAFLRDAAFGSKRLNPNAVLGGKKKGN